MRLCTACPFDLGDGVLRWDRHDIDDWIDGLKSSGPRVETDDEILGRFG